MEYKDVMKVIKDVVKFVQNFTGVIDKCTPHLYLSALPFSPSNSMMARNLVKKFPGIAQVVVGQHDDWPRNEQVLQGHTGTIYSVAFSPDGRHIVSGSRDQTTQIWDAQPGGQLDANGPNNIILSPINFSSLTTHALTYTQSLFTNLSPDVKGDCRDFVHFQDDGWIVGPNGRLLLWIPLPYHSHFKYTPWTNLVIPKGFIELDLSRMCHGSIWHKCYSSVCVTT